MIYFFQMGKVGPVKIGVTRSSLETRRLQLQTGNPETIRLLGYIDVDKDVQFKKERELQKKFHKFKIAKSEWFAPADEIFEFINRNNNNGEVWEKNLIESFIHQENIYQLKEREN